MSIYVGIAVVFTLGLLHDVRADAVPCEDLNTAGCVLFLQSKPDLCTDPILSASCKRFCGLCPLVCYDCPSAVSQPGECNATKACGSNEMCMLKHHTGPDGSHEYIMSCESNQTCEGLNFGFHAIVGRRDLSFHCCNTDYCNLPPDFITTSPAPTTMTTLPPTTDTPTTTTLDPLHQCTKDIVFVVDGSSTIGPVHHSYLVSFIKNTIQKLTIGQLDSLVATVEYSDTARVEWYLNSYPTKSSLITASSKIPYVSGSTATHAALWIVRNSVLTERHGDRANAGDVVVIITDGGTTNHALAVSEAKLLRDQGVLVIGVGVGPSVDKAEMSQLVGPTGQYFTTLSYSMVWNFASQLASAICNA